MAPTGLPDNSAKASGEGRIEINRREFGRLLSATGVAAYAASEPVLAAVTGISGAAPAGALRTFTTRESAFTVDAKGSLCAITFHGRNYLSDGQPAPLLSLRIAGKLHQPTRASWDATKRSLTLAFDEADGRAVVAMEAKATHVALELIELRAAESVELVVWGPYPIGIGDLVGEVVGVVRDSVCAVGIQALNVKTLGGIPVEESDIAPDGFTADDRGIYPGLPDALRKQQNWRGDTASATTFGSTLQAYCRNRDKERIISNWGNEKFDALPFGDGGVIGSRIALFAVPATEALATLGAIELAEALPHPRLEGVWAKQSPCATQSYLIVDFGEATMDEAIRMTQRAGLKVVYHSSPFETWGHFKLKPDLFPRGWEGFRECVTKAGEAGIGVGFHTLSNFITPNDNYVTPIPDRRLARIGSSELTAEVDAEQTEIPVADPVVVSKENGHEHRCRWRRADSLRGYLKRSAMAIIAMPARRVGHKGISASSGRGGWQAHGSSIQGVPHRCRAGAGSGAQDWGVLQLHRRDAAITRRPGGKLVFRHGSVRLLVIHQSVVRRADTCTTRAFYQRRQQSPPLHLAHCHALQLGRTVVCGLSREPDDLPAEKSALLHAQPDSTHAGLVFSACGDNAGGCGMALCAGGRVRRGVCACHQL